jgi:hypothetical protein
MAFAASCRLYKPYSKEIQLKYGISSRFGHQQGALSKWFHLILHLKFHLMRTDVAVTGQ